LADPPRSGTSAPNSRYAAAASYSTTWTRDGICRVGLNGTRWPVSHREHAAQASERLVDAAGRPESPNEVDVLV
jgi:hypothetical protein